MNITPVVKQLLIINIIFYIGSQIIGEAAYHAFSLYHFENTDFRPWQLLTHMFMHEQFPQIGHIFFNMFALYSFGSALEHFWGGKKFLFFYISCGIGAALFHSGVNYFEIHSLLRNAQDLDLSQNTVRTILNINFSDGQYFRSDLFLNELKPILENVNKLGSVNDANAKALFDAAIVNNTPAVGASGAIYGLLVAFAFMFPNAELMMLFLPIPIKAKFFVPAILLLDLYLGVSGNSIFGSGGGGVAHFAHIGGAIVGFIMMWIWKKNQFNDRRWN